MLSEQPSLAHVMFIHFIFTLVHKLSVCNQKSLVWGLLESLPSKVVGLEYKVEEIMAIGADE